MPKQMPKQMPMKKKTGVVEAKARAGAGDPEEIIIDDTIIIDDDDSEEIIDDTIIIDDDDDSEEIIMDDTEGEELETLEEEEMPPPVSKPVYFRGSMEAHKKHLSHVSKQLREKDAEVLAGYKKYKKTYDGQTKLLFFSFAGHWRRTEGITEWIKIILSTMSETIAQAKITGIGPVIYEKKMDGQIYSQKTMELVRTFKIYITPADKVKIKANYV